MHISLLQQSAVLAASALALAASAAFSAEWTSFPAGQLDSFSFTHAFRTDGQFILGKGGQVAVQTTFGAPGTTPISNTGGALIDPSFLAIRGDSQGLIGGGFSGSSGVFLFDPSSPATPITTPALASLQNYAAVFWKHPVSGREGWIISGANGTFAPGAFSAANNLTFISTDGTKVGPITGDVSSFSGGLATDAAGNVFVSLADLNPAEDNKVLQFTAGQVDAAVLAVLGGTPAPLAAIEAALVKKMDASGSLAVDSLGRVWVAGFQINHLQAYDPVSAVSRRYTPDHAPLPGAGGPSTFSVSSFTRNHAGFVGFLANDSFYNTNSGLAIGYKPVAELSVLRSVQFTSTAQTASESAGTVNITVTITPAPTARVTVPVQVSGTATKGKDYTATVAATLTFDPANTTRVIPVKITNDLEDEANDNETFVLTLGTPAPVAQAGLGSLGTETFTLTITDDDVKPRIADVQNFGVLKVGAAFSYQVANTGAAATKWTASGLPPGLKINPATGLISGIPATADEYDQVWITATNSAGVSTSVAYVLNVTPFPAAAVGAFTGLINREGGVTGGLGGRVSLVTTSKSSFTGKVEIGKTGYPVKGALDNAGTHPAGTAAFKHAGASLVLNFTLDSLTGELTGSLAPGPAPAAPAPPGNLAGAAPVTALLSGWRAQTATALTGVHNFLAAVPGGPSPEVPEGTTHGCAKVAATGLTTIAGVAADGSPFTSGSPLDINGGIIIYQALYKVPGSLCGSLTIADNTAHAVTGGLTWSRPSQGPTTPDKLYPTGWNPVLTLTARGGKYRPAAGATLPLNASRATTGSNARLLLQDGGINALGPNPTTLQVRVASAASLIIAAPHKLALKNDTGLLTGSLTFGTGAQKKTLTLRALLVPDETTPDPYDTSAQGFFLLPASPTSTRSGMVLLEALQN